MLPELIKSNKHKRRVTTSLVVSATSIGSFMSPPTCLEVVSFLASKLVSVAVVSALEGLKRPLRRPPSL